MAEIDQYWTEKPPIFTLNFGRNLAVGEKRPMFDIVCAKIRPKPDGETTDLYDKIRPKSRIVQKKMTDFYANI